VELLGQAPQIAGAVVGGVVEAPDQHLVEDRSLVPTVISGIDQQRHPPRVAHGVGAGNRTWDACPAGPGTDTRPRQPPGAGAGATGGAVVAGAAAAGAIARTGVGRPSHP